MYKCESCSTLVKFETKEPPTKQPRNKVRKRKLQRNALKIVVETREQTYKHKLKRGKKTIFKEGFGWEIVKELTVCQGCYDNHTQQG